MGGKAKAKTPTVVIPEEVENTSASQDYDPIEEVYQQPLIRDFHIQPDTEFPNLWSGPINEDDLEQIDQAMDDRSVISMDSTYIIPNHNNCTGNHPPQEEKALPAEQNPSSVTDLSHDKYTTEMMLNSPFAPSYKLLWEVELKFSGLRTLQDMLNQLPTKPAANIATDPHSGLQKNSSAAASTIDPKNLLALVDNLTDYYRMWKTRSQYLKNEYLVLFYVSETLQSINSVYTTVGLSPRLVARQQQAYLSSILLDYELPGLGLRELEGQVISVAGMIANVNATLTCVIDKVNTIEDTLKLPNKGPPQTENQQQNHPQFRNNNRFPHTLKQARRIIDEDERKKRPNYNQSSASNAPSTPPTPIQPSA